MGEAFRRLRIPSVVPSVRGRAGDGEGEELLVGGEGDEVVVLGSVVLEEEFAPAQAVDARLLEAVRSVGHDGGVAPLQADGLDVRSIVPEMEGAVGGGAAQFEEVGELVAAESVVGEILTEDGAVGDGAGEDGVGGEVGGTHGPGPDLAADDGAVGELGTGDRAVGEVGAGDAAGGDIAREQGVADGSEALVGREELRAVHAIVEPDPHVDVLVLEHGGGEGGHVREGVVAQEDGVVAVGDGELHRVGGFRAGRAGAVVAPEGIRAIGIDEGDLEEALPVEVDVVDDHAALEVDELRDL